MSREQIVTVVNRQGLHARASARLVNLANQYRAEIKIVRPDTGQVADAKSILSVMFLAAQAGTSLVIVTEGPDEAEAVESLGRLIRDKFGEEADVF